MTKNYQNHQKPKNIYDIIELLKQKPELYLGKKSISCVNAFLYGVFMSQLWFQFGMEKESPDFDNFHDWIAKKYNFKESTSGWVNMIMHAANNKEDLSLMKFFEDIDEYKNQYK